MGLAVVPTLAGGAAKSEAAVAQAPVVTAVTNLSREVFGFALASSLSDPSIGYPSWDFSLLSTVAFFGLHVSSSGGLVADSGWSVWGSSALTGMVAAARAKGTKVVVTTVLQDFQPGTPTMCAGLANRATTVSQTVAQVKAKGVDGVNVDYEGLNGTCPNGQSAQWMLTDFVRQLRAALPGYYVSVDTYASSASDPYGFFDVPGLSAYVDYFFVMAYDLEYSNWSHWPLQCTRFCLGPTAPLTGYYYNDTTTAAQYIAKVPASKVILGVPYYGRKACAGAAVPNAYPTGSVTADSYLDAAGESSSSLVQAGTYVAHRDANDKAGAERWDTWVNTSLGCTRELYWDDAASLGAKYDLVNRDSLRGVGIWTLNYGGGARELWSLLASRFARCTGASVSPSTPVQVVGTTVSFTAASTGCATPQYEFWIQYPNGAWVLKQGWGGPSFAWSTTGLAPGTYVLHAWATAQGPGYDAIAEAIVNLVGCTSAAVAPASTTQPVGATVAMTATSGGCPNPTYEFWVQQPNGAWVLARGWGGPGFDWSTAGVPVGTYTVHAWANQQGAAPTLEVYGTSTVTLTTCNSATITPAIVTQPVGSTLSFATSSTGCLNPRYEFWVQYPGGAWYLKQGWGGSAFTWNTSGLAPGTYTIHAWVNRSGTGWDAIGSAIVNLTGCTSASVTPSATRQPVGNIVTLTATSGGCANPTYEFWVQYPSGSWVLVRGWGGPTLDWNTAGLPSGVYTVHAWANQTGAAPTLEVYGTSTVTIYRPCTAASVSPASGSVAAGGAVTFAASASGCPNPMYEFWLLDPAGTWHLMRSFGTGNSWTWNTAGWAKGTYTVHVWADQQGSDPATHEAIGSSTYTVS
jgi:spore germination protein YaaH